MNEAAIKERLSELTEAMTQLPSGKTVPAASEGVYCSHAVTKTSSLEESLDQLRLQVKYLMFDLEATRRENRYLRQMLEYRRRPGREGDGEGSK